jgi:hypothetical protein
MAATGLIDVRAMFNQRLDRNWASETHGMM